MTEATHANDQQARVDRLRASRAGRGDTTATPPRRRPATGAKVAAAGLGMATMLGLVGAMGYAARSTTTDTQPVVTPAPQIVVVVHQNPPTASPTADAPATPASSSGAATTAPPAAPIALTARPVVRQAPAGQTPIATTHGSR